MSMLEIRKKKEKKKKERNKNLLCTAMTTREKQNIYTVDGRGEVHEGKEKLHHNHEYVQLRYRLKRITAAERIIIIFHFKDSP